MQSHYDLVLGCPNMICVQQLMRTELIFAMEQKVWCDIGGRFVQVVQVQYSRCEYAKGSTYSMTGK